LHGLKIDPQGFSRQRAHSSSRETARVPLPVRSPADRLLDSIFWMAAF